MQKHWVVLILAGVILAAATASVAQPATDVVAALKALEKRIADQDKKIADLTTQLNAKGTSTGSKAEIKKIIEELQKESGELKIKAWLKGLTIYGDLRLRYEFIDADTRGTKDRNRVRFRLRVGLKKKFLEDQMEVIFRLASGSSSAATSTNQTMTGMFSEKAVWIDRAYATVKPKAAPGVFLAGGKMPNYVKVTGSGMVWDSDVNPEGFWAKYTVPNGGSVKPFVSGGYAIITETLTAHEFTLVTGAVGATIKASADTSVTATARYLSFDFHGTGGGFAAATTATGTRNWDLINVGIKAKTKVNGVAVAPFAEWVKNMENDDARARTKDAENGYAVGVKVGANKKKGDWSGKYMYKYIEMNATPGGFTDFDFGGPNRKGHVVAVNHNITDDLTATCGVWLTSPIVGVAPGNSKNKSTNVQLNLTWKF